MDGSTRIKIVNRNDSATGYTIPELGVRRQFMPREEKTITFEELERLSYVAGGKTLLEKYFVIKDPDALKEIFPNVEPEYYYTDEDVKRMLLTASYDEFLDCLDFAPDGVLDMIKDYAVSLEINDLAKREAILNKLGLDVTKAIEIKNTKYDGDSDGSAAEEVEQPKRRVQVASASTTKRRVITPTSASTK